jgi:hypothetical protein
MFARERRESEREVCRAAVAAANGRRKKREERPWRRFGVARVMEWARDFSGCRTVPHRLVGGAPLPPTGFDIRKLTCHFSIG